MQVVKPGEFMATCRGRNGEEQVNMMLTGSQPEGAWILSFLGSAREVLTENDALNIDKALDGLTAIASGASNIDIDAFFPGLGENR